MTAVEEEMVFRQVPAVVAVPVAWMKKAQVFAEERMETCCRNL